ncbi:MAG: DinB family protein [Candidatus Solibacter sp.]
MNPLNVLIEMNIRWLGQAMGLLNRLNDAEYATCPSGMEPHRAGGHLRHIIEFYQAFLDGLDSSHIDYDARRRDPAIERSRTAANAAIQAILRGLHAAGPLRSERIIWVKMEDCPAVVTRPFMESSVSRELQLLSSHTIHHFALIAMTLRLHGVQLDPEFGMAPSTLRYLAARREAA